MRLALRELVRRPSRFVTAIAILALIAALLIVLGGLLDGLIRSSTGAVRSQSADVFVFSRDSRASFLRSRIDAATRADVDTAVAELAGVAGGGDDELRVGSLGVVLLGARRPNAGPRDLSDVAVWGYELATDRLPQPPAAGTGYADRLLESDGVSIGDVLLVGPARTPIEIVGWVDDTAFNGQGGVWTDVATWHAVLDANRPGLALASDVSQALVVTGGPGVDTASLIEAIEASGSPVEALDERATIEAIPGVVEQRATFTQILGVTVLVALIVVALFFALLTVERASLYAVLKAVGATSARLLAGLMVQAVAVTVVASLIAIAGVAMLDALIPPGAIPLYVSWPRVATSVVMMLIAAVVGSAASLRRVLRVDPAAALAA